MMIIFFNKWDFQRRQNRVASLATRFVYEDRWGGELQWAKRDRGSNSVYGESIFTNRFELIGNYQLPMKEKMFLDYSYNYHNQDSYYGVISYQAMQHVGFTQLRMHKTMGSHEVLGGIPFRFMYYDDNTIGTKSSDGNDPSVTFLPGIFLQDEWAVKENFTILSGIRYDHHNKHGNIFSPRVSFKYSPSKNQTIRLSSGNGFRVVNLFTEDHAALTGSRQVVIAEELKPEQSWNVNLNYAVTVGHSSGYVNLDGSLFYTYFTNKIVGDYLTNSDQIIFDNLHGHAISKGITLNADIAFTNTLKIIAGLTVMDVYQVEDVNGETKRTQQLFAPHLSGTYTVSYTFEKPNLTLDLTGRTNGPMSLPIAGDFDPRPSTSPTYSLLSFQLTKVFNNGFEVYGGVKNLLNFLPDDPLLNPQEPFSNTFDTSYNYAPVQGIKGFAGVRFTIP
jgi:outer membrane receptor for ferrienterochelin and colicins